MSPKSGQRFWDNDMHSAKLEDFMSPKSGQRFWDNDMHSTRFESAPPATCLAKGNPEIEGRFGDRKQRARAARRAHPRSKIAKQKKNKFGYRLFFSRLMPLAKREQMRYKLRRITDCPAFIDDQGVMYHGSEYFAACRG
jgi:hypothetical protein